MIEGALGNSANGGLGLTRLAQMGRREPLVCLLITSLALSVTAWLQASWSLPLWFDEAFSGTIAAQPTLAGLFRWCRSELTGPAFYGLMWLWAKLAGTSDMALRVPPFAFAIAAPLLLAWRGHRKRELRLLWATLALLWLPMLPMATEARPYPQLFFLASLQAILFLRAIEKPSPAFTVAWATVTALAGLTHYYSLLIGGFQGLALLLTHRRSVRSLWPAILPFVPLAGWMAIHLPFVLRFALGHAQHYEPIPPWVAACFPVFLFGYGLHSFIVVGLIFLTWRYWWRDARKFSPEGQLVWTGVAAFSVLVIVGMFQATMMPRYVTSAAPALLFGVACWAAKVSERQRLAVIAVFALLFIATAQSMIFGSTDPRFRERKYFESESASAWLAERAPKRLFFLWSTRTAAQANARNLAEVAGFFLKREGRPVDVFVVRGGRDPNQALLDAAHGSGSGSTVMLWVSDDRLAAGVVPEIERRDPEWECRNFGGDGVLIYACRHRLPS